MEITEARTYGRLLGDGWSRPQIRTSVEHGDLTRPLRGVYGPVGTDVGDLRSLFVRLPPGTMLAHQTAARLYSLPAPDDERVHVIVPTGAHVPLIKGVAAHASVLPVPQTVWLDGVPCVPPHRCAVDLARLLRRHDALAVLDATLRAGLCSQDRLNAEIGRHAGLRGVVQARELVEWADPRAECVQESHLRLVLLDAGLPAPEPQIWIKDESGRALYRVDLGYPEHKIGAEYDGSSHLDAARMRHDRARHNWLADHGWQIRYFTARDLYRNPHAIVKTISTLLPSSH